MPKVEDHIDVGFYSHGQSPGLSSIRRSNWMDCRSESFDPSALPFSGGPCCLLPGFVAFGPVGAGVFVLESEEELVVELPGVGSADVVADYAGGEAQEFGVIEVGRVGFDPGEGLGGEVVSGVGDVLEGEDLFAGFGGVG